VIEKYNIFLCLTKIFAIFNLILNQYNIKIMETTGLQELKKLMAGSSSNFAFEEVAD